jgi:hypothetical protein
MLTAITLVSKMAVVNPNVIDFTLYLYIVFGCTQTNILVLNRVHVVIVRTICPTYLTGENINQGVYSNIVTRFFSIIYSGLL